MIKKKQSFIIPALMVLVITIAGCSPKEKQDTKDKEQKIDIVKVKKLEEQQIARVIEYSSTLDAFKEIHLVPASPGKIDNIYVEVGSRVSKGDVLVQMDRTQLYQAMVQLKNVETDYKRLDTLQKAGSIAEQKYDQIKTQYEIAKSNVEFLEKNTQLRAPFSGVISGKYYEDGEMFSGAPNTTGGKAAVVSIVQMETLKAIVSISEKYFPLISNGMEALVKCDIYPELTFKGTVFRVHPTIDPASRSFNIEVKVSNPVMKLRPGMFCRVTLELGQLKALVVPAVAVLKLQGSNERFVFVEKNGKAKRVGVEIGNRYDEKIEIISPELKLGDNLIVSGQDRLLDGVPVKVVAE